MSEFALYFQLGFEHILDLAGYDHIVFVIALCAVYSAIEWKRILILVTAFTIGHSITLALSTLNFISFNDSLIEFLIPVTIFVTALSNVIKPEKTSQKSKISLNYIYALLFGLVHGMGFSNSLKGILGKSSNIVQELLAFNLGLELGQIVIVIIYMTLALIFVNVIKVGKRRWSTIISVVVMVVALTLMYKTKFW